MPGLCRDCLEAIEDAAVCPGCGAGAQRLLRHAELDDLDVAHIDCDAFYAAVEKRDDPSLRDKPLIVGHPGGRGVVTTACYIARKFGPRSAMPMFQALRMCPDAVVIPPNMAKYQRLSRQIREIFLAATPVIEPVSLDEAYLDLSADVRSDPRPAARVLAETAMRIERDVNITVSIGLSYNKFLAKLASDLEKPRGFSLVGRAEARDFLAPLPVAKINGVGPVTAKKMADLGITEIRELQAMPESQLVTTFGKFGRRLAGYVQGVDERQVTSHRAAKSISAETTFAQNIATAEELCRVIKPLCERVAGRLERNQVAGHTLVLKLKTADFQVLTRNRRLPHPTQQADVIYEHAADLIAREADGRYFRLIGVGLSDLCPAAEADPPDLFGGRA
ncbi:MAG TPA: DNA polymerase IV [Alphaproteobacteria bacterium]|jgi:DNA polymerase-4|nr:DNA polymerase IV [Alphaproteobacteria bacterium]